MGIGPVVALVVFLAVIAFVVELIRRSRRGGPQRPQAGSDFVAYLLLALAVGGTAISLAALGRAAFPERAFISGSPQEVATALAGVVVAGPLALILWRRQARRRSEFPASGGWTAYLAVMELAFMITFIVAAVGVLEWVFQARSGARWTDAVVYGGVVAFHEWASRRTPPMSEEAELPRVLGGAISLVTLSMGFFGALQWLLEKLYATISPLITNAEIGTAGALMVTGGAVWWYRWLRRWGEERSSARKAWLALASVVGMGTAIGALVYTASEFIRYLAGSARPAGAHFEFLPQVLALGIVAILVWWHHIGRVGKERDEVRRAYEYAMAALGLAGAIAFGTTLSVTAFGSSRLVSPDASTAIAATIGLVAALVVWWVFWSRAMKWPREIEAKAGARRVYLVGFGVVAGLTAAGSLIATLVVLFQALLGSARGDSMVVQASLFVFAGLATWHVLRHNAADRALIASDDVVTPFDVTVICSDPGSLESALPEAADVRVIYRADEVGVVTEEMAAAIVEAVANRDSLVWVDENGFRVAPAR